jgi:hypothetical protein
MTGLRAKQDVLEQPATAVVAEEPRHAGADWREHDLVIRRFHLAGMVPTEIAVILNSKGLKVKTWAASETFVRNRLKALGLAPNMSRTFYAKHKNSYEARPETRTAEIEPIAPALPDFSAPSRPLSKRKAG